MELHQLRYFVAAADAGSVSRAAERCHVAQPSLSQQLKKLEESLGVTLFDRFGRGVVLTDAGRALLPKARRILAELRDAETNLRREVDQGNAPLILGAIPTLAPYVLPRALERLRVALPSCTVSIREGLTEDLVEALLDHEIDCALVSTPLSHELLDVEVIAHEEMLLVLPTSHPLAERTQDVALGSIRGQPTVILQEMHCLGRQIQGFCSSHHVAPRIVCSTTQLDTIFEMVALGMGISLVPEMAAAADTRRALTYRRLRQGRLQRQIAVAWRRDRTRARAALRLVEIVRSNFANGAHKLKARSVK
jgi:LysR family transcriptional regulator, hydrogen peroxide-inducible genes activator